MVRLPQTSKFDSNNCDAIFNCRRQTTRAEQSSRPVGHLLQPPIEKCRLSALPNRSKRAGWSGMTAGREVRNATGDPNRREGSTAPPLVSYSRPEHLARSPISKKSMHGSSNDQTAAPIQSAAPTILVAATNLFIVSRAIHCLRIRGMDGNFQPFRVAACAVAAVVPVERNSAAASASRRQTENDKISNNKRTLVVIELT